ncbi:MAG: hypothetical protein D6732_24915, partial [Methanobacteriota archaeon]
IGGQLQLVLQIAQDKLNVLVIVKPSRREDGSEGQPGHEDPDFHPQTVARGGIEGGMMGLRSPFIRHEPVLPFFSTPDKIAHFRWEREG